MNVFIDSGAPTLYNTLVRVNKKSGVMGSSMADRKHDDFSFIHTDKYKLYRESYINFVKEYKNEINLYANLDIINNPEETWKNQKYFESKGLNPLPIFHFGSDVKWLQKYIAEGYEYIAIGGLIPNSFSVLQKPLDDLWNKYLTDKNGYPVIKVHGFAVTSPRLVHRYPWYSVDSTSWVKFGMYGAIVIPKINKGAYDYTRAPIVMFLSIRSPKQFEKTKHILTLSDYEKMVVESYVHSKGFILGLSTTEKKPLNYKLCEGETIIKKGKFHNIVEVVTIKGLVNDSVQRDMINAKYFMDLCSSVPEWPWAFSLKQRTFL